MGFFSDDRHTLLKDEGSNMWKKGKYLCGLMP